MLEVLKALKRARDYVADQPPLVKSKKGHAPRADENGVIEEFWYPDEAELRALSDAALRQAGIFDIPEDVESNGNGLIKVTWALHLLDQPDAEPHRLKMAWPVDVGNMTRPNAAVASLSHAWRHAMMLLLKVRVVDRDVVEPGTTPWTPDEREQAARTRELDEAVGEGPAWAAPPAPAMLVQPDAQWRAVDAVVEPAARQAEFSINEFYLWWTKTPAVAKRWPDGLLATYRAWSKNQKATHLDEAHAPEFAAFLYAQLDGVAA